jgi:phospholipid/cholesterol/gamma-HCH transport system substrate-binding protein
VVAISLTGGAAAAAPVPLDDGIPTLTADLSEIESICDTLHNVDRIPDNRAMLRDALLSFETYTASLASRATRSIASWASRRRSRTSTAP